MKIYRGVSEIHDIDVDLSTTLRHTMLGNDLVNSNFSAETNISLTIGDYINWGTKKYTIRKTPIVKKEKSNKFVFNVDFYAPQYDYGNVLFMLDGKNDFSLMGNVSTFLDLITTNMNRVALGTPYSTGSYPSTDIKNMTFNQDNCLTALQKVCVEFGLEYVFDDDGLSVDVSDSIGVVTGLTFEFKQGLRNIEKKQLSDGEFMTRLYPYGSKRNTIFSSYGHERLRIDGGVKYIENNVGTFGVIERSVIFDDIYPRRTGTITGVDGGDPLTFTDSSMDFDVNDQLTNSIAKITFNTGLLAGYEFEISNYDDNDTKFDLVPITDDQDRTLPNSSVKPQIGDEYVIHDIEMPSTYIDSAEQELLDRATDYLDDNSSPAVVYDITPDPVYFETNLITLKVGDIIDVTDTDFGIVVTTKIVEIQQSLANPYEYVIRVGNRASVTLLGRIQIGINNNKDNIIKESVNRTVERLRIAKRINDLNTITDTIFDVDGNFDGSRIKPLSIETAAMSVGAKPLQMNFIELEIEQNYQESANKIRVSDCSLVHFTIEETPREWNVTGNTFTIPDNNFRYLYVVVDIISNTGVFQVSEDEETVEETSGKYTFLVGIIHSVQSGTRGMSMVYGQTFINGRYITTGRIQSIDTLNYFDLDEGSFNLGNGTSGIDWNVTTANKLTIRGSIIQSPSGAEFPIPVNRGVYTGAATYYRGDTVYYNGSTWLYLNLSSSSGNTPAEGSYWTLYAAAGDDNNDPTNLFDDFDTYTGEADFLEKYQSYTGSGEISFISGSDVGAKSLQVGSNFGNDTRWLVGKKKVAFHPEDLYSLSITAQRFAGSGTFYFGVVGYDENGDLVNVHGAQSMSSQFYIAAGGVHPNSKTTYIGYFQGHGPYSANSNDPASPSGLHADVRYIALLIICNYSAVPGITVVHSASMRRVADFSPVSKGTYSNTTSYSRGSVVDYLGRSFIAKQNTYGFSPALTATSNTRWQLIADKGTDGADGADGSDGDDGSQGPGIVARGNFVNGMTLYNNSVRKDVVKHGGVWYLYNHTDGLVQSSFIIGRYTSFGAQFESVATNLLLAESANIADWIIVNGMISSQSEFGGDPKVVLNGNDGEITIQDGITVYNGLGSSTSNVPFSVELSPSKAGIEINRDAGGGQSASKTRIRPDQIYINGARPRGSADVYDGRRIAVEASVLVSQRDILGTEYIAAVYGAAGNSEAVNPCPAYGGYFSGLYFQGPVVKGTQRITSDEIIDDADTNYLYICAAEVIILMPPNPVKGRTFFFKRTIYSVALHGNSNNFYSSSLGGGVYNITSNGDSVMVVWDGFYWQVFKM